MAANLREQLKLYGALEDSVRWLDEPTAQNIDYLDLVAGVGLHWDRRQRVRPAAVVENDHAPLLYVVEDAALGEDPAAKREAVVALRARLACRGDAAWLAISEAGRLVVYGLGVGNVPADGFELPRSQTSIQNLAARRSTATSIASSTGRAATRAFHDLLYRLITKANRELLKFKPLHNRHEDVLALVGRALFARFLIDRGVLTGDTCPQLASQGVLRSFSSGLRASILCRWLDVTFNGDLLPLAGENYPRFFAKLDKEAPEAYEHLSNILYHAPDGQLSFAETWGGIDFAHVPIGLLSEVYEQFAHQYVGRLARAESIHYTPRHIAAFLLDQSLLAVRTVEPHESKVLDPAVGGGVFLTLAYRRLVAMRWQNDKRRPTRGTLRSILNKQLSGFDINVSALKLTALSLYLTALELDPNPKDLKNLSFDPLIDLVLHKARGANEPHPNANVLGSIGPVIGPEHNGKADLVIGNAPWTAWKGPKGAALNTQAEAVIRRIAGQRAELGNRTFLEEVALNYKNPDKVPDLAFAWRATEWAKPHGVIALALHGRLLFKQSPQGKRARIALFNAIRVTGILNGAALRLEPVWPDVDAPWCMLFARNEIPREGQTFSFVSPHIESERNAAGLMRVDHDAAEPIEVSALSERPFLLKTLFRGTALDAEVLDKIRADRPTLSTYWQDLGDLKHGIGLQVSSNLQSARPLWGKPYLDQVPSHPLIATKELPLFRKARVHRLRDPGIYEGPVVLFPQAVPPGLTSLFSAGDCVYNRSFVGYSAKGASDADKIARHVFLLSQSVVFPFYVLMTSSQFGVERDALLTEDVDSFPMVRYRAELADEEAALFNTFERGVHSQQQIDEWVCRLYGLGPNDLQTMRDTLATQLPFTAVVEAAQKHPDSNEIEVFTAELARHLSIFLKEVGAEVVVASVGPTDGSWIFLNVACDIEAVGPWVENWVTELANRDGASQIVVLAFPGHVGLGILAQRRYWTRSRARLTALMLVRKFSDHLLKRRLSELTANAG